ncbi:phage head-tail adapter protein [Staphylococcus chromogenes]|uniref:phage head-tail adapter protein n=1 Tax=Staphylococcus chromogenes TaxID=46126 RepID=UPI000D1A94F9|nr:phage head-tail adapter protein [Staphylococcus chromogenes]PTG01979.1 phage head-tail adapter protein [Staphylococcus chromogenes]PTG86132.1 phage head-tail adapter protein [Staphylococcus chromogenes]PTH03398.1 phage head-tail adapter protein [Staphylococcus chromogenes]
MTLYEEIKLLLKKNGVEIKPEEEDLFKMEVDGILEDVRDVTNNDFIKDGQIVYPYPIKKYVADVLEYYQRPEVKRNLKSRSMGTVSYTYNDGVPDYISGVLNRYKRAKFHVFRTLR